jgi:hypothetical protein
MIQLKTSNRLLSGLATLIGLALSLLLACPAHGQVAGATLSGTVTDASGSVIPNAQVAITDLATGVTRTVTTGGVGSYTTPNLLPGTYEIRVTATGFSTQVHKSITLTVGAQQALDIKMQIGQVSQTVEVTTEAPKIELASSTLGGDVTATNVRELPLNGRDWTQLATLTPGVMAIASIQSDAGAGFSRGSRGYGGQLTISGARPQQNNYRLDGISVNDYTNGGPGNVLGGALGVDAIQEFSVLTSNYSTEYGRTSGGVINAITRSGTNQFHGSLYEFLRNSALDARNNFDNATIPPFKRNQFGVSAGGPILRNRAFFFADYEGLRQSLGVTFPNTVPSADARNGILNFAKPADFPSGCVATSVANQCHVTVDPLVKPYFTFWPLPNGGLLSSGNTGVFSVAEQQVGTDNFFTTRVDHKLTEKDSLFGTYLSDRSYSTSPDTLNDVVNGQFSLRQTVALEESHTFSSQWVNSVRVGYNRVNANIAYGVNAINPAAADVSLGTVPGRNAPQIVVPGLTSFGGGLDAGTSNHYVYNSYQGYDDAFVTKGIHSLRFGASFENIRNNGINRTTYGGQYRFGTLASFLTNRPTSLASAIPAAVTPRNLRQVVFGAYLQDDVRWRSNFTVNWGLRYEMATVPIEADGKLSALQNPADPAPHLGEPFFSNPTLRNFEPRVGFAWDPFRTGKTSVRAGFGLFDVLPLIHEFINIAAQGAPFALLGNVSGLPQGSFPKAAFDLLSVTALRQSYVEPKPHRNYVMQWNLNLQRELTTNLVAMVAYVGSRGVHQPFRADDANIVLPTLTSAGYLWPSPRASGVVINPKAARINYLSWESNSFYDAFELQIVKKMSHGFQVQGSYTWSKSIDEGSSSNIGNPFENTIASLFFFDRNLRRGPADFNTGQNLLINYTWLIPTPQFARGAAGVALGGWQLGGIFQMRTGLPFTPTIAGDPLGLKSSDPWAFPNRLVGPGCESAVNPGSVNYIKLQCFTVPNPSTLLGNTGRNSLVGPGLQNFDFSLTKNTPITKISENFNAQFRVEVFNLLNRANFAAPLANKALFDQSGVPVPGAGLIDRTATIARQLQFGLKLIW